MFPISRYHWNQSHTDFSTSILSPSIWSCIISHQCEIASSITVPFGWIITMIFSKNTNWSKSQFQGETDWKALSTHTLCGWKGLNTLSMWTEVLNPLEKVWFYSLGRSPKETQWLVDVGISRGIETMIKSLVENLLDMSMTNHLTSLAFIRGRCEIPYRDPIVGRCRYLPRD